MRAERGKLREEGMSKTLASIDSKIAKAEAELAELRKARDFLAETLLLTPTHPEGKKHVCVVMEVMGREIEVGTKQAVLLQMLTSINDTECVPSGAIRDVVGSTRRAGDMMISRLRKKLKAAQVPAEIVWFPGEGYRLQVAA